LALDVGAVSGSSATLAMHRFLDRLRTLLAVAASATALMHLLAVAAVVVVLNALVVEHLFRWPWAACTLGLAVAAVRLALAMARPSRRAAARRIQEAEADLRNDVESSLELEPLLATPAAGISSPLVGALVGSTGERLDAAAPRRFVAWRAVRTGALLLAAGAVPLAAVALTGGIPGTAVRALIDPRVYWPLGRIQLAVEPGDARIARGADLLVRVRAGGGRPSGVLVGYAGAPGEGFAAMEHGPDGVWFWRFAAVSGDFTYRAVAGTASSAWYRVRVADVPAAGNFEVHYTYPAYCGLPDRTVAGSGEIEALKGTTAAITFSTVAEVAKAALVFGGNRVAALPAGELRHRAVLYLNGETSYRIELEDPGGLGNGGGPEYAVRYLPDAPPSVEVTEPQAEVESDPRGTIAVRYRCADDYGISRLALVARSASGEHRLALPLSAGSRSAGGAYEWDLGPLGAEPGESVSAFVEAADNDTISGPKVGASAVIRVRIADPREKREQTRESMEKLAEELVQLLGEELDLQARYEELEQQAGDMEKFPWDAAQEAAELQKKARDSAARAQERAERLAEAMDRDPGAREESILQADLIAQGVSELRERQLTQMQEMAASMEPAGASSEEARQKAGFLAAAAEQAARRSEELVLMAEAMKRERGMADVERGSQEMGDAEERLLESLERLSAGDRAAAEQVLKQLEQIEQALRDLSKSLQEMSKELPEDFLNSDALKGLDLNEVLEQLDQVRELLSKGDIAGARQAARELAKQLADLRNRLRQAEDEVDEKSAKAFERLTGSTIPKMRGLADRQRALLERTEALQRQVGPRLEQALRALAREQSAAAPPAEADVLTPGERGRLDALAGEQQGLRQSTESLAAEVGALRGALPFLPAEVGASLEEAAGKMGEAGGRLGGYAPSAAVPSERSALAALQRAGDRAAKAAEEMAQMQQMRQGKSGMPMGMGSGSGFRPGGPGSDASRGRRSGGRRGTDVRNFLIPGRQDHRVPKIFREEIMKSLQDGYPARYEERIKDYYQRIAE
jgi:tetratricopeptide (TPR) repeat protein